MRFLRIVLQLVILIGSGIAFASLVSAPRFDVMDMAVFFGFLAFLFALTLALGNETERRLNPERKSNFKYMGIALILLGAFGVFHGFQFLGEAQPLVDDHERCRAICSLIHLSATAFGESIGRIVAFSLWSGTGLFLCVVGYKIASAQAPTAT